MTSNMEASSTPRNVLCHYAHRYLRESLERYGNQISADHDRALMALCELSEQMITGELTGRVRFGLPCGMGKTTGIRAVIKAVHDLDLPFRIAVACSKVEELCQLKRKLREEDGVLPDQIGLMHSYPHCPHRNAARRDGTASEPSEGHDRQFLLVTHANVQAGIEKPWMQGRDVVFFDESLIVSEALWLPLHSNSTRSIKGELGALQAMGNGSGKYADALNWFNATFAELSAIADTDRPGNDIVVQVPRIDPETVSAIRQLPPFTRNELPNLSALLQFALEASELRVFTGDGGHKSLVTYTITVPDSLNNVIVLDASDPIRKIVHSDRRMQRAEAILPSLKHLAATPGGLSSAKFYSQVEVFFACDPGGRDAMRKKLAEDRIPWPIEKLVRLLKASPDESFLIFTFKARDGHDYERKLRKGMEAAGIDAYAVDDQGRPRISILRWGQETGTNEYVHCTNVVLLGVIFQPQETVAGRFLGQLSDIRSPWLRYVVKDLTYSECAHSIYQAINRGAVRQVDVIDGIAQAKPCKIYVWHRDADLEERLRPVLRGVQPWMPWREPEEKMPESEIALLAAQALRSLEQSGQDRVSLQAFKKFAGPTVSSTTWARCRDVALSRQDAWVRIRGSLVRQRVNGKTVQAA